MSFAEFNRFQPPKKSGVMDSEGVFRQNSFVISDSV